MMRITAAAYPHAIARYWRQRRAMRATNQSESVKPKTPENSGAYSFGAFLATSLGAAEFCTGRDLVGPYPHSLRSFPRDVCKYYILDCFTCNLLRSTNNIVK